MTETRTVFQTPDNTIKLIYDSCDPHLTRMNPNSVDLILTDPEYDLDISDQLGYHMMFGRICHKTIIVFSKPENQWTNMRSDEYGFWVKPISTKNTSKSYSRFVEVIQIFHNPLQKEGLIPKTWNADRHWSQYTNVFTDLVESKEHPWKKPYSLIKRLVLNHTNPGDLVLDPFMGSGTVPEVCYDTGRRCIGIEIKRNYFETAVKNLGG